MKFYWLPAENRYVHRQADIPKGVDAVVEDIAIDQASLMERLNRLVALPEASEVPEAPQEAPEESPAPVAPSYRQRVLHQCDVEDAIQAADAIQLRCYAENVADRQRQLKNLEILKK